MLGNRRGRSVMRKVSGFFYLSDFEKGESNISDFKKGLDCFQVPFHRVSVYLDIDNIYVQEC